jgi:hypothetical protein
MWDLALVLVVMPALKLPPAVVFLAIAITVVVLVPTLALADVDKFALILDLVLVLVLVLHKLASYVGSSSLDVLGSGDDIELLHQMLQRVLVDLSNAFSSDIVLEQVNSTKVDARHAIDLRCVIQDDTDRNRSDRRISSAQDFVVAREWDVLASEDDSVPSLEYSRIRNAFVRRDREGSAMVRAFFDDDESPNVGICL